MISSERRAVEENVDCFWISLMPAIDWDAVESSNRAMLPFCSRRSDGVLMIIWFSDISGVPMIGEHTSSTTRKRAFLRRMDPNLTEQLSDP